MSSQLRAAHQPTGESAQPYRRHIVGLPLQQSLFRQTAIAATTIGLPCLKSEQDFPARLDENGDLFLDRAKVATITDALLAWFRSDTLEFLHAKHAEICASLVHTSEEASHVAATLDGGAALSWTEDFAHKTALVMTYGILSKFVPDVLLRALASAGDILPPPFPAYSAGSELLRKTFRLQEACCALGYPPLRLRSDWPDVPPEVFRLVTDFCHCQRGFGPLAWESPGYEDPGYVVRLLFSAFGEVDSEQIRSRLFVGAKPAVSDSVDVSERVLILRRVLAFWLDFLEKETWYVRRAFYVGMVPLLQRVAEIYRRKIPTLQVTDLLFLHIDELAAEAGGPEIIEARRARYLEDTKYLSLQGVDARRLTGMLQSA